MATTVVLEDQVEIPLSLQSLADFRRWALSDEFPQRGRIDYVAGRIEVDMAPEESFCHGTLKTEIVSDSSVAKDTRRFPKAYFKAGVRELWLADARHDPAIFRIHHRVHSGFVAVEPDAEGFQPSTVFGRRYRLDARLDAAGHWEFDLKQRA